MFLFGFLISQKRYPGPVIPASDCGSEAELPFPNLGENRFQGNEKENLELSPNSFLFVFFDFPKALSRPCYPRFGLRIRSGTPFSESWGKPFSVKEKENIELSPKSFVSFF